MPIYNIYLVDLVPSAGRRLLGFSESTKTTIASRITSLFERVCEGTAFTPQASFLLGTPHSHELVVYFLPTRSQSIIGRVGGQLSTIDGNTSGATYFASAGMISEVWLDPRDPAQAGRARPNLPARQLANLAFHELMHNKVDAHPQLKISRDMHNEPGEIGLRSKPIAPDISNADIRLMRRGLHIEIPQFWDPGLIFRPR